MKSKKPTIRTVAKEARVGVATVSRTLNHGSVSPELAQRVHAAIETLGFRPHAGARSLARRQSNTIGLVVSSTRGSWFSELIAGVEEALIPSRRSVVLGTLRLTGEYDSSVIHAWLDEQRVDGLLLVRCSERERPLLETAKRQGIPVVLIAPEIQDRALPKVQAKNGVGGELAARHLWDLGHRNIAFMGGPNNSKDTLDRLRGIQRVLARMGGTAPWPTWFARNYYPEGGRELVGKFLALDRKPTAVVCACDALALGFAKELLARGIRIPDDVSLVGFDNSPEAELFWPGLTSIAQPTRAMAHAACSVLLAAVDGMQATVKNNFDLQLHQRSSTRAVTRADT